MNQAAAFPLESFSLAFSKQHHLLYHRMAKRLKTIYAAGLDRQITDLHFFSSVEARDLEGKKYLVFCSNNYLGLTHRKEVREAAARAALMGGTSSTGSRLITGGVPAASRLEKRLARFKKAERVLLLNTGYMANLGVLYTLAKPGDVIYSDALNHASIIDGCRISGAQVAVYRHSDMDDLEEKLETVVPSPQGTRFLVTDGVFSMDGDICRLPDLVRLKEKYQCLLMVDDAHAEGVIGPRGEGTAAHFGLEGAVDVTTGTLSKTLASEGGYVAADSLLIEYLKNRARPFVFSTYLSPADTAAAEAALKILEEEGEDLLARLRKNTALVRRGLEAAGIPVLPGETPLIPILVGNARKASALDAALKKRGILLSAIRPPSVPMGSARLRLTVTAGHTEEQIRKTLTAVKEVWRKEMQ